MNVVTEIECLRPLSAAGEPGALWPAALPGGAERLIMRWRAGHSQQRSSVLSCSVSKEAGVLTVGLARLGAGEPARACAALPSSYQDLSYGCSLCNPT